MRKSSRTQLKPIKPIGSVGFQKRATAHFCTPDYAVQVLRNGCRVFVQAVGGTPKELVRAVVRQADNLRNVEICHIHTSGDAPYADEKYSESFFVNNFFVGGNLRKAVREGRSGYVPIFLSAIPQLFDRKILPLDVALISVSPPDKHGYCSLGPSVDITLSAIRNARYVIAQVNKYIPRTHGDGIIHLSQINLAIEHHEPLDELKPHEPNEEERLIGQQVASLIEDGSTLQIGIGRIPNAIFPALAHHKNLGIHSEGITDGVIDLLEKGVINNSKKKLLPGKLTASFVNGTRRLYDFIDDNPLVSMMEASFTNNPQNISQNPKVCAINSAIEVDLTGQVCADSVGGVVYSGVGGQLDFMRGAAIARDGKPIIALPSTTKTGRSRIVPYLQLGAGVVTTRAHVHYVVTEYGIANLFGKNLTQRMDELTKIAHPKHRQWLQDSIRHHYWQNPKFLEENPASEH